MIVLHVVYFAHPVNSSTIQDLHFSVLSRTLSYQTDFPGISRAWRFQEKIQDFPGCVGTLINKLANKSFFSFCSTSLLFHSYSRLGPSPKKVNIWELLEQELYRQDAFPVTQPTASNH